MAPLGGKAVSRGRSRDCGCSGLRASFECCNLHIWTCGLPRSVAGSPRPGGSTAHCQCATSSGGFPEGLFSPIMTWSKANGLWPCLQLAVPRTSSQIQALAPEGIDRC